MSDTCIIAGYVPGAIGKIAELHALYYHKHWNFGLFFEALVATELATFLQSFDEKRDGFWLVVEDGNILGSVAIAGAEAETKGARLRWFILAPEAQGRGFGKLLMHEAMQFCERAGFQRVYLTTFAGLSAARHLYEQWGFRLCAEGEDTHWGSNVLEQTFERINTNATPLGGDV